MVTRIVVLDGHTLNPGDLDWAPFARLGSLTVFERTPADLIFQRAASAEIVLTNKTPLTEETIRSLPLLRYIGVLATGCNNVALVAAAARKVPVCNVRNYGDDSVAQMVFAHILHHCNRVAEHASDVAQGGWGMAQDFCYWLNPLVELRDLTLGVVGLGEIGGATGRIARAFGMQVLAHTRRPLAPPPEGVEPVGLDELFTRSDFLSLHCPLTPETERLVNADRINLMKRSAFLVNTGRGPLIDESALAQALNEGRIAGAGLDVLSIEPPGRDNPLIGARNCAITPHVAWATRAARERLLGLAAGNLVAFLRGEVRNQVNP
jgi:glycerate dehydrogenase